MFVISSYVAIVVTNCSRHLHPSVTTLYHPKRPHQAPNHPQLSQTTPYSPIFDSLLSPGAPTHPKGFPKSSHTLAQCRANLQECWESGGP